MNNSYQDSDDFERSIPDEVRAMLQAIEDRRAAQVGQPFDPSELLRLATEQWPDMPLVAATFALCTLEWSASELYTHFLGYTERRSLLHDRTEFMQHPTLGELAVDLVLDARVEGGVRVVGIEYMDRVFGQSAADETIEVLWPPGMAPEAPAVDPEPLTGQLRMVHVKGTLPAPAAYTAGRISRTIDPAK